MKGSGASGNRDRALVRSPPCRSGSSKPRKGIMSVALALIAMLIELCLGYPQWLVRMIGHPVTWIGSLIAALDRLLNAEPARRAKGIVSLLIVIAIVGSVAFLLQHELLRLSFGLFFTALIASSLIAQRSL